MGYHASLARTFRTYLSAEYNLETSRHEGLDIIENAVDNLDSRSDKHKIMDMHNQVFCPPMRFEYLPHMGDEVRCSKCCYSLAGLNFEEFLQRKSLRGDTRGFSCTVEFKNVRLLTLPWVYMSISLVERRIITSTFSWFVFLFRFLLIYTKLYIFN